MDAPQQPETVEDAIVIDNLTMGYGDFLIQKNLNFGIHKGDIFIIMGGSGCGKSTLLRHMIGLIKPKAGRILYGQKDLWALDIDGREALLRNTGVLYQAGALWSSMTLAENVSLALEQFTRLSAAEIRESASASLTTNVLPASIRR